MSKSNSEIPSNIVALYDKVISGNPHIERKGKTTPYTSLNGHMFSFLSKEGIMGLRLSENDRNTFIQDFNGNIMQQHGRIMKEYVEIPNTLLENTTQLATYLEQSLAYVSSLKPKPAKKKK